MSPGYWVSDMLMQNFNFASNSTVEDGQKKNFFFGSTQSDNTKTTIPKYHFMFFYVLKMAVAIAFLCENAVEAI